MTTDKNLTSTQFEEALALLEDETDRQAIDELNKELNAEFNEFNDEEEDQFIEKQIDEESNTIDEQV